MSTRQNSTGAWEQFTSTAEDYERDLVPDLFEPWARRLIELADLRPGERVLDLACGTGIVARLAATSATPPSRVIGLDVNPGMLTVAQQVAADRQPNIEWWRASAHESGLPDAVADVLFCQQGMQFFDDRRAAAREIHRLTAPGGRAAVSTWIGPTHPAYASIQAALARNVPHVPAAGGFIDAIFSLSDGAELQRLLVDAGFDDVQVSVHAGPVQFASPEAWVRALLGGAPIPGVSRLDADVFEAIVAEAAARLAVSDGDGFVFQMRANVAVGFRPVHR